MTTGAEWVRQHTIRYPPAALVADAYAAFPARLHDGSESPDSSAVLREASCASPGIQGSKSSDAFGRMGAGGTTFDRIGSAFASFS